MNDQESRLQQSNVFDLWFVAVCWHHPIHNWHTWEVAKTRSLEASADRSARRLWIFFAVWPQPPWRLWIFLWFLDHNLEGPDIYKLIVACVICEKYIHGLAFGPTSANRNRAVKRLGCDSWVCSACISSHGLRWSPWPWPGCGSASVPHLRYLSVRRHFYEKTPSKRNLPNLSCPMIVLKENCTLKS